MTSLKSLIFTTLPKSTVNPTLDRRTKIIARLEEQKALLRDLRLRARGACVGKEQHRRKSDD